MSGRSREGGLSYAISEHIPDEMKAKLGLAASGGSLTYTIGDIVSSEQYASFKRIAGGQGESKDSFQLTHRQRVLSCVNEIFNRREPNVFRQRYDDQTLVQSAYDSSYRTSLRMEEIEGRILISLKDHISKKEMSLSFPADGQNPNIKYMHNCKVALEYSAIDDKGNVEVADKVKVEYWGYLHSESEYSRVTKDFTHIRGVILLAEEDEQAHTLTIRDDYDAKGSTLPLKFNIYDELKKVE